MGTRCIHTTQNLTLPVPLSVEMDVAPRGNDNVYIPLRFAVEGLDALVVGMEQKFGSDYSKYRARTIPVEAPVNTKVADAFEKK